MDILIVDSLYSYLRDTEEKYILCIYHIFPLTEVAIATNGALQLASPGTDGVQGLQTLTMTNASGPQPGTTILQYAQTSDGQQILVPSNQVVVQSEYAFYKGLRHTAPPIHV